MGGTEWDSPELAPSMLTRAGVHAQQLLHHSATKANETMKGLIHSTLSQFAVNPPRHALHKTFLQCLRHYSPKSWILECHTPGLASWIQPHLPAWSPQSCPLPHQPLNLMAALATSGPPWATPGLYTLPSTALPVRSNTSPGGIRSSTCQPHRTPLPFSPHIVLPAKVPVSASAFASLQVCCRGNQHYSALPTPKLGKDSLALKHCDSCFGCPGPALEPTSS